MTVSLDMYPTKIIKKVPGTIPPPPKQESQGYLDDLSKKATFELKELLDRQNKLLANKIFIARLPDKGKKIITFRDKLLKELKHKDEVEKAAQFLSKLNIASEGKAAMSELEWTGNYTEKKVETTKVIELDSDDDEDPLKILAQPTGTGVHKKKIIHVPKEETLIKPEDLEEIELFQTESLSELEHVKYIVNMVEKEHDTMKREPFRPYKTTKSNVHDPAKEKQKKHNKNWEVTAATPPHLTHDAIHTLGINESLKLQKEQADKLQEIQAKHATERLAEHLGFHAIGNLPARMGKYRSHPGDVHDSESSSSDDEEHEVHDDEDYDKRGTVVFTVDSIES